MSTFTAGWVSLDGFVPVLAQWDRNKRWNGWLCPHLDPLTCVKVLDAINSESGDPVYAYDWTDEGYLMLIELQDEDGGIEFIEPNEDGLYGLGYMAWIWSEELRVMGTFQATVTRDGEGLTRDGEPFIDLNPLEESDPGAEAEGGALYEIQFTDGQWMLAREADLVTGIRGLA